MSYVDILLKKSKIIAISNIVSECLKNDQPENTQLLHQVADSLLNPKEKINKPETIEWIKWLLAAGKNPEEFSKEVIKYDTATLCGLVWIANFVAYRCRTCAISPCMSLCAECFQKGDHEGHDFNMFRSLAGGACDCGDESVMKTSGFCVRHSHKQENISLKCSIHSNENCECKTNDIENASHSLLFVAKGLMAKIINRLLVELRRNSPAPLKEINVYIVNLLNPLASMGAAMRSVISKVLIDPEIYFKYAKKCESTDFESQNFFLKRYGNYLFAKSNLPNFDLKIFYTGCTLCPQDQCTLKLDKNEFNHNTFAEELLFWTIVYEFPQKLVCFLINMLPDADFKKAFAKTFVYHYSRISMMLTDYKENVVISTNKKEAYDFLSNCVVHVSVQLLSNESLAVKLCEKEHIIFIMIASLKSAVEGIESINLIESNLQDINNNKHKVVRCDHDVIKKHCYWPIVSDFNNILTHKRVAFMFISNIKLFRLWLDFIIHFQGMNLNTRETISHVKYENDYYYASFSSELEICAAPLWTIISHIKKENVSSFTFLVIECVFQFLYKWFDLIGFTYDLTPFPLHFTFHIPLHRYYSIFIQYGVQYQNLSLDELLPQSTEYIKLLLSHPLQIQIKFYEILCGLWVRNGLQIKSQAITYIQCHFCNSMIDPDLFLIQQLASKLSPDWFITTVLKRFHVYEWFSFNNLSKIFVLKNKKLYKINNSYIDSYLEPDQIMPMIESALTFLCMLFTVQTNLGLSEEQIIRKEMVTLLCIADRTYSQLYEFLPEKCGTFCNKEIFDKNLSEIADFKKPALESGGNLSQGIYYPKPEIWLNEYDPIYVLLRVANPIEFQSSMDRYTQFIKSNNNINKNKDNLFENDGKKFSNLWPPFRLPPKVNSKFGDPTVLLNSKVLHGIIFTILYRALYTNEISERVIALTIFLLQISLHKEKSTLNNYKKIPYKLANFEVNDLDFEKWFHSSSILKNINVVIRNVVYEKTESQKNFLENSNEIINESNENQDLTYNQRLSVGEMEIDLLSSIHDVESNLDENYNNYLIEYFIRNNIDYSQGIQQLTNVNTNLAIISESSNQHSININETGPSEEINFLERYNTSRIDNLNNLIDTISNSSPILAIKNSSFTPPPNNTITMESNLNSETNLNENVVHANIIPEQTYNFNKNNENIENECNKLEVSVYLEPSTSSQTSKLEENNYLQFSSNFSNLNYLDSLSSPIPSTSKEENKIFIIEENEDSSNLPFLKKLISSPRYLYNRKRSIEYKNVLKNDFDNKYDYLNFIKLKEIKSNNKNYFNVNESLISLLIKLCGPSFTYQFDKLNFDSQTINDRIGDANHFIKQIFDLYCDINITNGKETVESCFALKLFKNLSTRKMNLDKEERKRKAKERQQKLIAEFSNKQKAFMNQMKDELQNSNQNKDSKDFQNKNISALDMCDTLYYECVICGQTSPSTSKCLIGMVVLLQSSSILAHCTPKYPLNTLKKTKSLEETYELHKERINLIDEDSVFFNRKQTLGSFMEERIDFFDNNFDKSCWLNAINIGWEGGVHVQSCGHYLHLDCHHSYMLSLRNNRTRNRSGFENSEFLCPLCRQLANSVLPINPRLNKKINIEDFLKKTSDTLNENLSTSAIDCSVDEMLNCNLSEFFKKDELSVELMSVKQEQQLEQSTSNSLNDIFDENDSEIYYKNNYYNVNNNKEISILFKKDDIKMETKKLLKETSLELIELYSQKTNPDPNLLKLFGFFCEDLIKATGPQFRNFRTQPTKHSLYLFLCSILRTNLETELLVKISKSNPTGAKKSCIIPLFHTLALNCQFLIPNRYVSLWSHLTGLNPSYIWQKALIPKKKKLPLLLIDTCAILIQLLFALPLNIDERYFDAIVQNLYNLNVIQALCQISSFHFKKKPVGNLVSLETNCSNSTLSLLNYIINFFQNNCFSLYSFIDDSDNNNIKIDWTINQINNLVINICLPFIRLSALIKCYLYKREYPNYDLFKDEKNEYHYLAKLLNLISSSDNTIDFIYMPQFVCYNYLYLLNTWLKHYAHFAQNSLIVANKLLNCKPIHFVYPKLLNLPLTYDQLYLYYYKKKCSKCRTCPKEPCICLICSKLVCMRQDCCIRPEGTLEAIFHSQICGAGTALYLAVHSSTVIVIRGKRVCVWGSVYLDSHGEEDCDLKRGKPLYLSELRYLVLEHQWLTHSFDHTNKKWVWHKDIL